MTEPPEHYVERRAEPHPQASRAARDVAGVVERRARKARRVLAICTVVAIASIAAVLYLAHLCNRYFKDTVAVRLDPAGLRFYETERRAQRFPGRPLLVLFGDSRALMWSTLSGLNEYEIVNRGVGNQTTAQVLLRMDDDLAPLRPRVVVLEVGVNDLKAVTEFPERREEIVNDCERNIGRIVQRIREMGATVVLVGIFGIGDVAPWRRPFWSEEVIPIVHQVNAHLRSIAGSPVFFLDPDPILDDARGRIKPEFQFDFLHLDEAGYSALNQRLVPLIRSLP